MSSKPNSDQTSTVVSPFEEPQLLNPARALPCFSGLPLRFPFSALPRMVTSSITASLMLSQVVHASPTPAKMKSKPSRTRMMTHIKALRWLELKLDLPVLTALQSQTVADFLKSQIGIPFERSEASPILLAVLAAWKQRIVSNQSSLPEIITLGCFLIATMASLRFRDLLRTKPESFSVQGHILRGISWHIKTSVSGQPWSVCYLGLSTRPSEKHWVFPCLEAIQRVLG